MMVGNRSGLSGILQGFFIAFDPIIPDKADNSEG